MKSKFTLLFITLLFALGAFAQRDLKPGYIIQDNGDTLYGEIDVKGTTMISNSCIFRKDKESSISEFSASEIRAYRITDGKFFVSKTIIKNNLSSQVFLEFLIQGALNIYYLRNENGEFYYIEKKGGDLIELPYEEGIRSRNNVDYYYQSTLHFGVLKLVLKDAPDLDSQIDKIKKPEHRNLINLAKSYHNEVCKDEKCIIYEKNLPAFKLAAELVGGVDIYLAEKKVIPQVGIQLYAWMPNLNDRLFIKTGLVYEKVEFQRDTFNNILRVPIQLEYVYPKYRIKPKINIGMNYKQVNSVYGDESSTTFNLGCGINYSIYKGLGIGVNYNTEYASLLSIIFGGEIYLINYSVLAGIYYIF
jgi:hypothetical protein